MNRIAIFSDLHIPNKADARNDAFAAVLKQLREQGLSELWLLGDIFDLLVGPYEFWTHIHAPIFDELDRLSQSGCKILWLEGNHDFHLRRLLEKRGIDLRDGDIVKKLTVQGQAASVLLAHGDLVNLEDAPYLKWRAITRDSKFRGLLSLVPELFARTLLLPLAESASRTSRRQKRDTPESITQLYRAYADQKFREGYRGIFLGHCHVFDLYSQGQNFYLNLGSWLDGSTRYGLWEPEIEPFPKVQMYRMIEE